MNCPRCESAQLLERERDTVIVDVCPSCRGVWLDKGELDKLIAKSITELNEFATPAGPEVRAPRPHGNRPDPYARHEPDSDRHPYASHHKRKRSWLESFGDLFD